MTAYVKKLLIHAAKLLDDEAKAEQARIGASPAHPLADGWRKRHDDLRKTAEGLRRTVARS